MRILVVNNLFPPFAVGGYETRCAEACAALVARGHIVEVLVGNLGGDPPTELDQPVRVHRELSLIGHSGQPWRPMPGLLLVEMRNRTCLRERCQAMKADIVWIWNLGGLGRSLVAEAVRLGPMAMDISDHWLLSTDEGDPWVRWCQRHPLLSRCMGRYALTGKASLPLDGAYFTSAALRDLTATALPAVRSAPIIYCGIDVNHWTAPMRRGAQGTLRCLYAGRLHPDKGVGTACKAFLSAPTGCQLTIAGTGDREYEQQLRSDFSSQPQIRFVGRLNARELAVLMQEQDCLIFPSEWAEPFALVPLEASAAGLVIVGTLTGGTGEFLVDGVTGLSFPPGDHEALRQCLIRLRDAPDLRWSLTARAQQVVSESFTRDAMVERMERHLLSCCR